MDVERIKFERTGGFAGMRIAADFEMDDLTDEQAHALEELFDDLDFAELPEQLTSKPSMPDEFTYKITVETEKGKHTIVTGDASAPEKMQKLLHMLNQIARKHVRKNIS